MRVVLHDVPQDGSTANIHHRLWTRLRLLSQACTLSSGKDDYSHADNYARPGTPECRSVWSQRRSRLEQPAPLVTIGMPTYNGARFLAKSIDALLLQDYPNFELVISDNCSTDDTAAIARAHAERSDRVRYVGQETHIGVSANFNRALS